MRECEMVRRRLVMRGLTVITAVLAMLGHDQLLLDMIDANGPLTAVECPVVGLSTALVGRASRRCG